MDDLLFFSFVIASVALIIIPGPNVLVIISTSVSYGSRRGLQTVLGTSTAMIIQLLVAALGTAWVVSEISHGFSWLRWLGVAYLLYLGIVHLRHFMVDKRDHIPAATTAGTFTRGFIVSLTNPKTILFFSAFLPQFVSAASDYHIQIMILSATFLLLAVLLDSLYALLAGRLSGLIKGAHVHRVQNCLSGIIYVAAGIWLAVMRRLQA